MAKNNKIPRGSVGVLFHFYQGVGGWGILVAAYRNRGPFCFLLKITNLIFCPKA